MNHNLECNREIFSAVKYCFFARPAFNILMGFNLSLGEGDIISREGVTPSIGSVLRIRDPKRKLNLMNAIKSITPILLTMKIETPSTTLRKGIFLIQENIVDYPKDRTIANLGAEVP
jgi:hypothetical protein